MAGGTLDESAGDGVLPNDADRDGDPYTAFTAQIAQPPQHASNFRLNTGRICEPDALRERD